MSIGPGSPTVPSPHAFPLRRNRRRAFTIVELMIVIVAMTILAGILVPQVEESLQDANQSAMLSNLYELTNAIERYKMDHNGRAPQVINSSLPQLVNSTDVDGNIGSGPGYPYGPYILGKIPANPLNNSARVKEILIAPPANAQNETGWLYYPTTGQIWAGERKQ